jgi:hypothetical protein
LVRRQKRHPRGFNENLYNLQSIQNKPINDSLLPSIQYTETSQQPSKECPTKRWEPDREICFKRSEIPEIRPTSLLLASRPQLLRRPKANVVLRATDLHLKIFTKQLIFKNRNFSHIENQFVSYLVNFPLVFEEKRKEVKVIKQKKTTQYKSVLTPELKHEIIMKSRLFRHQRDLNKLREEDEPDEFETELWDDEFDPTTWDWKKFTGCFKAPGKQEKKQ